MLLAALEGLFSTKSDVFSFGVVLWELLTKRSPHAFWLAGLSKLQGKPASLADVAKAVRLGSRLPFPSGTPAELTALVLDCWNENPSARPDISAVIERLKALRNLSPIEHGSEGKADESAAAVARVAQLESQLHSLAAAQHKLADNLRAIAALGDAAAAQSALKALLAGSAQSASAQQSSIAPRRVYDSVFELLDGPGQ